MHGDAKWNGSLPERLLDLELRSNAVRPRYLEGPADHAFVETVVSWMRAHQGAQRGDVEVEQARGAPARRRTVWLALGHLLQGLCGYALRSPIHPALLRAVAFEEAAAGGGRTEVLGRVADRFQLERDQVEQLLYADVPCERVLGPLPSRLDTSGVVAAYNIALAQGLLRRARSMEVEADGQMATVLRHARRQRLLCLVQRDGQGRWRIHLSGPLALFHHTTRYGRAMAGWLPVLVRAPGWRFHAVCQLRDVGPRMFDATHLDPISAVEAAPLRLFDSALEREFARGVDRLAGDRFKVLREADPVQVGGQIGCPDFTLVDRRSGERFGVELVGFWTPEYLERKLALLRRLPQRWVICIDENLAAGREAELPDGPLFRFRRRVDVRAFLRFLDHWQGGESCD